MSDYAVFGLCIEPYLLHPSDHVIYILYNKYPSLISLIYLSPRSLPSVKSIRVSHPFF